MNWHRFKENFGFFINVIQLFIWTISFIIYIYSIVLQKGVDSINYPQAFNFGPLRKPDAIFLTGLASLITMLGVTFFSLKRWKTQTNGLWFLFAVVFDLIAIWFYFRYWIGEDWWIYVCVIPISLLFVLFLGWLGSKMPSTTSPTNPITKNAQNMNRSYPPQIDVGQLTPPPYNPNEISDSSKGVLKSEFNSLQEPQSDWNLHPHTLYGIRNLEDSYKELPPDVSPHMHDLTRILIKKKLIKTDLDVYNLNGFVNQIKEKKTVSYLDVLETYGKSVADEMNF